MRYKIIEHTQANDECYYTVYFKTLWFWNHLEGYCLSSYGKGNISGFLTRDSAEEAIEEHHNNYLKRHTVKVKEMEVIK